MYIERTPWHDEGFAAPPEQKRAEGTEKIYRVSGGGSLPLGNCFFVPALGATPLVYWTADLLENELNAAFWGNEFRKLHVYRMLRGADYKIGPVAHDLYAGVEKDQATGKGVPFTQRAYFQPSGMFKQVTFVLGPGLRLALCVTPVGAPIDLAAGRFAREATARAKRFVQ